MTAALSQKTLYAKGETMVAAPKKTLALKVMVIVTTTTNVMGT